MRVALKRQFLLAGTARQGADWAARVFGLEQHKQCLGASNQSRAAFGQPGDGESAEAGKEAVFKWNRRQRAESQRRQS